jgi:hypothetical protein
MGSNYLEHSPSWQASVRSAGQEISSRMFITVFTRAHHWSLSCDMNSLIPSYSFLPGLFNIIPHLRPGLRDCLSFQVLRPTLHIWRPSPPSATWGRAMPWRQRTHSTGSMYSLILYQPVPRYEKLNLKGSASRILQVQLWCLVLLLKKGKTSVTRVELNSEFRQWVAHKCALWYLAPHPLVPSAPRYSAASTQHLQHMSVTSHSCSGQLHVSIATLSHTEVLLFLFFLCN